MTKTENELIKRVEWLEKEVARLAEHKELEKADRLTYTVAEAAKVLGMTSQGVYRMIARGEIETVKIGRMKIKGESLQKVLKGEVA